jgi:hypothetical protein
MSTPPFQRNPDVWKDKQRQILINDIFGGKNLPPLFVQVYRKYRTEHFHLLEGQQRIETITNFMDNKIALDKKYFLPKSIFTTDDDKKTWKTLESDWQEQFKRYPLLFQELITTDDDYVRDRYVKLNTGGSNLNTPERRHADYIDYEFNTVTEAFSKQNNSFWIENGIFSKALINRMKDFELTAEFFVLVLHGPQGSGVALEKFYRQYQVFEDQNKIAKKISAVFRLIKKIFPNTLKETDFASISDIYALVGGLVEVTTDCTFANEDFAKVEKELIEFRKKVRDDGEYASQGIAIKEYYESILEGTGSKRQRSRRINALLPVLWKYAIPLDGQRLFTPSQRRIIWDNDPKHVCQYCRREVKSFDDFHADHITSHSKGGMTQTSNGQITHRNCNLSKSNK